MNLDQYGNTVGLELDLDESIAILAAREITQGELVTREIRQV